MTFPLLTILRRRHFAINELMIRHGNWNRHRGVGETLLENWVEERAVGDLILEERSDLPHLSRAGHKVNHLH